MAVVCAWSNGMIASNCSVVLWLFMSTWWIGLVCCRLSCGFCGCECEPSRKVLSRVI